MPQPTFHEGVPKLGGDFISFIRLHYIRGRERQPPVLPDSKDGKIRLVSTAYISEGRWVVSCALCTNAVQPSSVFPYFLCDQPKCLAEDWQGVAMPPDFEALGELVMLRPNQVNQNWNLGELWEDSPTEYINMENKLHGVS